MTSSYSEATDAGSVRGRTRPAGFRGPRPQEAVSADTSDAQDGAGGAPDHGSANPDGRRRSVAPRAVGAKRLVYAAIVVGLLQAAVISVAVMPLVHLRANRVPIVVTDEVVRSGVLKGLDSRDGVVRLQSVANGERARAMVRGREVRAAVVVDNSTLRLLVASAGSPIIAADLYRTLQQVAATSDVPVVVDDVRPTLATDRQQVALGALLLIWLVFGIGTGAVAAQRVQGARRQVIAILATVAFAALATSATMTWAVHILAGSVLTQAAALALLGTSAAAMTAAAVSLAPGWGAAASTVLLIAVGSPVSGAFVPPEYLGSLLAQGGQLLPPAAGLDALRGAAFFGGARTGFSMSCLAAWTAAGLIVVAARGLRGSPAAGLQVPSRRAPVQPPDDGERPAGGRHAQQEADAAAVGLRSQRVSSTHRST